MVPKRSKTALINFTVPEVVTLGLYLAVRTKWRDCDAWLRIHLRNHVDCMYSVFTINVHLAVRFATVSIGTRKAESPEKADLTGTCISECIIPHSGDSTLIPPFTAVLLVVLGEHY